MNNLTFSIITPTNGSKYLIELWNSIKINIDNYDIEWILLFNNISKDDSLQFISDEIRTHKSIKIYYTNNETKIGALKNQAFNLASGDILIEVDHDDMITEDIFDELSKAFSDPEIGFVHSDDAKLHMNGEFIPYNKNYGWDGYYTYNYNGQKLKVMKAFDADSGSMSFIYYMPNHVRAWRSSVYHLVGGHDVSLDILDDHDLLVKTYLVTKFCHIKKPLYIYRIHGENTWLKNTDRIRTLGKELFNKYGRKLAERDAELNNKLLVDIGGGIDRREGYISMDLYDGDIIADLNNTFPLEDNSVGVLNASHVIEHLKDPVHTMKEIHRVLCDGGWVFIDAPSTDGRGAWQDPTHVSFWNQNSFWYYTRKTQARYIRNTTIRFQEFRLETIFPNNWYKENNIPVVRAWLRAIKSDKRRPHHIYI